MAYNLLKAGDFYVDGRYPLWGHVRAYYDTSPDAFFIFLIVIPECELPTVDESVLL